MTRAEFLRRFYLVDLAVVEMLWALFSRTRDVQDARATILDVGQRLQDAAEQNQFLARRRGPVPPPQRVAVPPGPPELRPVT